MSELTTITTALDPQSFAKQVKRLNRKAVRLGVAPIVYSHTGSPILKKTVIIEHAEGECNETVRPVQCYTYDLNTPTVYKDGWNLMGRMTDTPDGKVFIEDFSDGQLDRSKYEDRHICCDHCKTNRKRTFGWIVKKDNTEMVVGKSCLGELLGGDSASLLEFMSHLYIFVSDSEGFEPSGGGRRGVSITTPVQVIATTLAVMKADGRFIDTRKNDYGETIEHGTNRTVRTIMENPDQYARLERRLKNDHNIDIESFVDEAKALIVEYLTVDPDGSFEEDMVYCLSQEYLPAVKTSLVAYMPRALQRRKEKALDDAAQGTRTHVGMIGKREDFELTCIRTYTFEGSYGETHVNTFVDANNNVLVWKTGSTCFEEGDEVVLKATVKAHNDYKGTPQTLITRAKVLTIA